MEPDTAEPWYRAKVWTADLRPADHKYQVRVDFPKDLERLLAIGSCGVVYRHAVLFGRRREIGKIRVPAGQLRRQCHHEGGSVTGGANCGKSFKRPFDRTHKDGLHAETCLLSAPLSRPFQELAASSRLAFLCSPKSATPMVSKII